MAEIHDREHGTFACSVGGSSRDDGGEMGDGPVLHIRPRAELEELMRPRLGTTIINVDDVELAETP